MNGPQHIPWPLQCGDLNEGEDTIVFGTVTALDILKTPAHGDMCYILGAQFVAASMNKCKGACVDAPVAQALTSAWNILITPGLCPGGLTSDGNHTALRATANDVKNILDDYNNGDFYGPGHCGSEQPEECIQYDCAGGCTLTRGYWQSHSANGKGKKNNLPWGDLNDGQCPHHESSILYGTMEWYDALATPPTGGNACLIAGAQYVAAKLNIDCNGACVPDVFVADALACVKDKLDSAYCPGLTPGNGPLTDAEKVARATLLSCSRTLDAYNNGYLLGPGHCDDVEDDGVSAVEDAVTLTSSQASGVQIATLVIVCITCLAASVAGFFAYRRMSRSRYKAVADK